jgi:hypothetical protein
LVLSRFALTAIFFGGTTVLLSTAATGCAETRYSGSAATQGAITHVIDQGEDVREVLLPRVRAGTATLNETRLLQAVCSNLDDKGCLAECVAAARNTELADLEHPARGEENQLAASSDVPEAAAIGHAHPPHPSPTRASRTQPAPPPSPLTRVSMEDPSDRW